MRLRTIMATAIAVALYAAAPAAAHITVAPSEAPADGFATLQVQVPHGCEGSPTRAIRVRIPRSVPSVTPQVHPGWEVTTEDGPKDVVELHGETVRRGVAEVTWTAADAGPLPDDRLDVFGMSVKLPPGEPGEAVYFPTVAECVKGQDAWIQIPRAGESADELEAPAPAVTLTAASGHGGASDDDGPSTGLVIVALVLGGLGLLTGLVALIGGRRGG
ncbi:MAG TPA: YcnI family protein [Thermoleophilaceae bacterium]|nr:YcnI family protein [Thermoleophilaceae bacterium]